MKTLVLILILIFIVTFNLNQSKSLFGGKVDFIYQQFSNRFRSEPGLELPGVECVYIITMPQRVGYITNEIKKLGITVTYFDAIQPKDCEEYYDKISSTNKMFSRIYKKYTRLPVLLSQIMCFMDALVKGYKTIIVFEDDIIVNVDFETLKKSITEFNASDMLAFYMGYCFVNCQQPFDSGKYRYIVELPDHSAICCHAMCMKTSFLPGLIDYCFPMNKPSDELYRDYYYKNNIKVCIPKMAYFAQNRKSLESLNESVEDLDLFKTCKF